MGDHWPEKIKGKLVLSWDEYAFRCADDEPLAAELREVAEVCRGLGRPTWREGDPQGADFSRKLQSASDEQAMRYAVALARFCLWCERLSKRYLDMLGPRTVTISDKYNEYALTRWPSHFAGHFFVKLMSRKLPFDVAAIQEFLTWWGDGSRGMELFVDGAGVLRAIERFAKKEGVGIFRGELSKLAERVRTYDRVLSRRIDGLLIETAKADPVVEEIAWDPVGGPAAVGHGRRLVELKRAVGVPVEAVEVATVVEGPDQYPLRGDTVLVREHLLISEYLRQRRSVEMTSWDDVVAVPMGEMLLELTGEERCLALLACCERCEWGVRFAGDVSDTGLYQSR
jgi:hypothetical protein